MTSKYWDIRTSSTNCQEKDVGCCGNHRRMGDAKFGIPYIKCTQENCPLKIPVDKMLEFFKELVYDELIMEGVTESRIDLEHSNEINSRSKRYLTKFIEKCQEGQSKWDI